MVKIYSEYASRWHAQNQLYIYLPRDVSIYMFIWHHPIQWDSSIRSSRNFRKCRPNILFSEKIALITIGDAYISQGILKKYLKKRNTVHLHHTQGTNCIINPIKILLGKERFTKFRDELLQGSINRDGIG